MKIKRTLFAFLCLALLVGCGSEDIQFQNLANENADTGIWDKDIQAQPTNCVEKTGNCKDGIDNDCDGLTDYPADPDCQTPLSPENGSVDRLRDSTYAYAWDFWNTKFVEKGNEPTSNSSYKNIIRMFPAPIARINTDIGCTLNGETRESCTLDRIAEVVKSELLKMPINHRAVQDVSMFRLLYPYNVIPDEDACQVPDENGSLTDDLLTITNVWGGNNVEYTDVSVTGARCPKWDGKVKFVRNKYRTFFAELKNENVSIDEVILDIEDYNSYSSLIQIYARDKVGTPSNNWYSVAGPNDNTQLRKIYQSISAHPDIQDDLNILWQIGGIGNLYGGGGWYNNQSYCGEDNLLCDLHYDNYHIWNSFGFYTSAQYIVRATYQVAKTYYPKIKMSNWLHQYYSPKYPVPVDIPKRPFYSHPNYPTHVGTHQAPYIYGEFSGTKLVDNDTKRGLFSEKINCPGTGDSNCIYDVKLDKDNSFLAFLFDVYKIRGARLANPGVPIQPWISHKGYCPTKLIGEQGISSNSCSNTFKEDKNYLYEELILHTALTGIDEFLYWNPHNPYITSKCAGIWKNDTGNFAPAKWSRECQDAWDPGWGNKTFFARHQDDQILDQVLSEFNKIAGFSDRKDLLTQFVTGITTNSYPDITGVNCKRTRLTNDTIRIQCPFVWDAKYLLSGMKTGGRKVWRLTPDPDVEHFIVRNNPAKFMIGGKKIVFPKGVIVDFTNSQASAGYWIAQPMNAQNPTVISTDMFCLDSDDKDTASKGTIRWIQDGVLKEKTDFCWSDTGLLGEWYCDPLNDHPMRQNHDCSLENKVCKDGRCY